MSENEESKCSQCLELFNKDRNPIKMPGCPHSLCDSCLHEIRTSKVESIQCSFCGFHVTKVQSKRFESNRLLALKMKEKSQNAEHSGDTSNTVDNSIKGEEPILNEENEDLLLEPEEKNLNIEIIVSEPRLILKEEICDEHEKAFEIICTTDLKMICPHCAIFGNHKDHCFKTLKEFNKDIEQSYEKLQIVKQQKYMYDKKTKVCKEKENIEAKINAKKLEIRKQVESKFKSFIESINSLQENICQEINNSYSNVFKEIMITLEQENSFEKEYNKWQSGSEDALETVENSILINEKIKILYGDTLKIEEGEILIEKLNKKFELQNKKIENLLSSVFVEFKDKVDFESLAKVRQKFEEKKDTFVQMIEKIHIPTGKHIVDDFGDENENSFLCEYSSKHDFSLVIEGETKRPPTKSVMSKRSNYLNEGPSKFRSPTRKVAFESSHTLMRNKSNGDLKVSQLLKNKSEIKFHNRSSSKINDTLSIEVKDPKNIVSDFIKQDLKEVLDLSRCELNDENSVEYLREVRKNRKIRGLKLNHNEITNAGFEAIIEFIGSTTNLNLSHNKLTEESLSIIIKNRDKLSPLRIVNFSSNGLAEKKCKPKIETLRKMGIIVNI